MMQASYQRMPVSGQSAAPQTNSGPGNDYDYTTMNSASSPPDLASSSFWQQQIQLSQLSRQTNSPHSYARSAAASSRSNNQPGPMTVTELAYQFVQQLQPQLSAPSKMAPAPGTTPVKGSAKVTNGNSVSNVNDNNNNSIVFPRQSKEDSEEEEQRRFNEEVNKQFWTAIDLSGQGLLSVSPKLFNFDFLQRLYLCHNKLTEIPPSIAQLTHLRVLDLSDNELTSVPAELGLMFALRYLFLFDNKLTRLPDEFGFLFQLDFLGIEGNPLPDNIKEIMANDGTRGVIIELREKAPVKPMPDPRKWLEYDEQTEEKFTIMTYNTLCDRYATAKMYGYTPSWALSWSYRSKLLMAEVCERATDIICLQEVDGNSYEQFWTPALQKLGYQGIYWQKTRARTMSEQESKKVDGCATFYRTSKFKLLDKKSIEYNSQALQKDDFKQTADIYNRVMNKDEIALLGIFESVANPGNLLIVGNTHIHWNPVYKDVKLVQTALLLEELERIAGSYASSTGVGAKYSKYTDPKKVPIVVCCDLNSTSDSGVCELLSQGKVPANHSDLEGRVYGNYTQKGMEHSLSLKSAYADVDELPFTNFTPNFVNAIDYIYISTPSMGVNKLLGEIDSEYTKQYVGFPNVHHPSDHIPLVVHLGFKKPKEPVTKPPPPNFGKK